MGKYENLPLQRSFSCSGSNNNSNKIIPAASGYHSRSSSTIGSIPEHEEISDYILPCRRCTSSGAGVGTVRTQAKRGFHIKLTSFLRSLMNSMSVFTMPTCKFLALPSPSSAGHMISISAVTGGGVGRKKVTGTLYGYRRGHVTFAVHHDPRSDPVFLLDLAMSTSNLVKEMSSGLVRIALECEKRPSTTATAGKLFQEPVWTMYCNGRKCGYAAARGVCTDSDRRVLETISRVSVGAGVFPTELCGGGGGGTEVGGELMYMRARFERVVGSRDSEAFYMLNPDKNGGPELSIFLLRI